MGIWDSHHFGSVDYYATLSAVGVPICNDLYEPNAGHKRPALAGPLDGRIRYIMHSNGLQIILKMHCYYCRNFDLDIHLIEAGSSRCEEVKI